MKTKYIQLDTGQVNKVLEGKYIQIKSPAVDMEMGPIGRHGIPKWVDPVEIKCPYEQADILFVKEKWAVDAPLEQARRECEDMLVGGIGHGPYFYADEVHRSTGLTWRPTSTCPKWVCRLRLFVCCILKKNDEWIVTLEKMG